MGILPTPNAKGENKLSAIHHKLPPCVKWQIRTPRIKYRKSVSEIVSFSRV